MHPMLTNPTELRFRKTPRDILEQNLIRVQESEAQGNPRKPMVALYACGSLCPVHRQHVDNIHLAKKFFESQGYSVMAAWIATSGDPYVKSKYYSRPEMFLNWTERTRLLRYAVSGREERAFIRVDEFDGPENGEEAFVEFYDCVHNMQQFLDEWMRRRNEFERRIIVYLVAGSDLINSCGIWNWPDGRRPPLFCVARTGQPPPPGLTDQIQRQKHMFCVDVPEDGNVSSTNVNRLLASEETTQKELEQYLHPRVAKYLLRRMSEVRKLKQEAGAAGGGYYERRYSPDDFGSISVELSDEEEEDGREEEDEGAVLVHQSTGGPAIVV